MILADKIMCLRKQQGWSQEELANKLGVSRQSVSKWESETAVPEMDKVVMLSEIFDVSTDFLLKDDLKDDCKEKKVEYVQVGEPIRREMESVQFYSEDIDEYEQRHVKHSKIVSIGVLLCIMSPVALILFGGGEGSSWNPFNGSSGVIFGLLTLFIVLGIAITLFVLSSSLVADYENLKDKKIELNDIDRRDVQNRRKNVQTQYSIGLAVGIVMIVLSALPLIITGAAGGAEETLILLVGLLLTSVAVGVVIIIRSSTKKDIYDRLLNTGEFTPAKKEAERNTEILAGIYWPIVVAVYLGWSLFTMNWGVTWIVWPVAALIFGGISGVSRLMVENRNRRSGF